MTGPFELKDDLKFYAENKVYLQFALGFIKHFFFNVNGVWPWQVQKKDGDSFRRIAVSG